MIRTCSRLVALSAALVAAGAAQATTTFVLTTSNQLARIDDATPGTTFSSVAITGLQPGEILLGIDFRPADEGLYALGNSNRFYRIDQRTGVATPVAAGVPTPGGTVPLALSGTSFGFDFNPTVDRIRVVSEANQNLRLVPGDGVNVLADTALSYAVADPNFGANPDIQGVAYTNNTNFAATTVLHGIDATLDVLVTFPSPNNGTMTTVGPLGVNATAVAGFDIIGVGTARAVLVVGGVSRLYAINLATGAATLIGSLGVTAAGIATVPPGYTSSLSGVMATFTGGAASQRLVLDSSGGLARHNRWSLGDGGFNSDFDFNVAVAGDQTLAASSAAFAIDAMGGDDTVTIGSATSPASVYGAGVTLAVNGGPGHDLLRIDDTAAVAGRNYSLSVASVSGIFGGASMSAVESVEIDAGGGADGFGIGATTPATTLRGGGGADVFTFANGGTLNGGLLDGGAGTDVLDLALYQTDTVFEAVPTRELYLGRASGAQEPGPLSQSGASGHVTATLDPGATALEFRIPYRDITGTISGAHFHNATAGINGTIVRGLLPAELNGGAVPAGTFSGTWAATDAQPLDATQLAALRGNGIYFNLHSTPSYPSGEMRGQLVAQGMVGLATGTAGARGIETFDNTLFADGFE